MSIRKLPVLVLLLSLLASEAPAQKLRNDPHGAEADTAKPVAVLWRDPQDIKSRNLFYGRGGEKHSPHSTFTFDKEDLGGTSPKFILHDESGVRWKAKVGSEARPETVASRLVWAVGFTADEDYFVPDLHVDDFPRHVQRRNGSVKRDGSLHNVRLKRYLDDEKKVGTWRWGHNPFSSTKEFHGLRVMMALINNWDLKDINTAIYATKGGEPSTESEATYVVSDLGATFGTTGVSWRRAGTDGILRFYQSSKFISHVSPKDVDFATPSLPFILDVFYLPDFIMRATLCRLGNNIPREDVRWMAQLLAQLSPEQIRDAFRAGGYSPEEVEGFAKVVENRISELNKL